MRDLQCEPEHFTDRIIFMSMYNDIAWQEKGNTERCDYNSQTVANYARKFPRDWSFLGPGSEKKWYGTYTHKPNGSWDQTAENMMANFSESGHPIFRASGALERGELRSEGHGKKSFYFNGTDENIELLSPHWFLRISSVSKEPQQIYATIYPKVLGLRWNLMHLIIWKRWKLLPTSQLQKLTPMHSSGKTWYKNTSENSNSCPNTRKFPNYVLIRVWSLTNKDDTSVLMILKKDNRCNIYAENTRCLAMKTGLV